MANPPIVRILCLGDSLTCGHSRFGTICHPYNKSMVRELVNLVPAVRIETEEDGVDGDLATIDLGGSFLDRIQEHFKPGQPKYDWTLVLGGTNDIGYRINPERIFANLKQIYAVPLSHGSKVLALTVPEIGIRGPSLKERIGKDRDKLNDLIKGYEKETENFHVVDLHAHVPYYAMSADDRNKYWDEDGLHFTRQGYNLIGQKVADGLAPLILEAQRKKDCGPTANGDAKRPETNSGYASATPPKDEGEAAAATPPGQSGQANGQAAMSDETKSPPKRRRKKPFPDDERSFDEERGNPSVLDRGYVVVRKKDLD